MGSFYILFRNLKLGLCRHSEFVITSYSVAEILFELIISSVRRLFANTCSYLKRIMTKKKNAPGAIKIKQSIEEVQINKCKNSSIVFCPCSTVVQGTVKENKIIVNIFE